MSTLESGLEKIVAQRTWTLKFLKGAQEVGVVDDNYIQNFVEQSLKEIRGFVGAEVPKGPKVAKKDDDPELKPVSFFLRKKGLDENIVSRFSHYFGERVQDLVAELCGMAMDTSPSGEYLYVEGGDEEVLEDVWKEMFGGAEGVGSNGP